MLKKDIGLFLTEENKSYGWDKLPDIIADPKNIRIPGAGAKFDKISAAGSGRAGPGLHRREDRPGSRRNGCPQVDEELART